MNPSAHSPPHTLTTDCVLVPSEVRMTSGHRGVFATEDIIAGTVCVVFGGFVTPGHMFKTLPADRQHHSLQIGDDLYLVCDTTLSDGDHVNHSCEPNLAFIGEISLTALRSIAAGEELTFDYATCDSSPYDEFDCRCAAPTCRKLVTGDDWRRPELRRRYAGRFAPYLQRRIDSDLTPEGQDPDELSPVDR